MGRQERSQVRLDPNGAHAGTSSTVRDAEGLVQVEVAHIGTNDARGCQAHLWPRKHTHMEKQLRAADGAWVGDGL